MCFRNIPSSVCQLSPLAQVHARLQVAKWESALSLCGGHKETCEGYVGAAVVELQVSRGLVET